MNIFEKYWPVIFVAFVIGMCLHLAICVLIIGGLFFFFGIDAILLYRKLQSSGLRSKGKILPHGVDGRRSNMLCVEFTSATGEIIEGKPLYSSLAETMRIHAANLATHNEAFVWYDPDSPRRFVLGSETEVSYRRFTFILLTGLLFMLVSSGVLSGLIKLG